jgi:hypothetical protein
MRQSSYGFIGMTEKIRIEFMNKKASDFFQKNACCQTDKDLLYFCLLSENVQIKIYNQLCSGGVKLGLSCKENTDRCLRTGA